MSKFLKITFIKSCSQIVILQGAQGEPGIKGERGETGLPVSFYRIYNFVTL